jgi:hypothetical protein
VRVRVDEAGDHGLTAEIDPPSVRAREPLDVGVRAHRDQPIAPDGDRLGDREFVVYRDDLAVGQHEVGNGLLLSVHHGGGRGDRTDHAQQQRFENEVSHGTS